MSVVGGARRSAFSTVMKSSVGPKMVAPSEPRIASGSGWASLEFQRTSFNSVLINGTVAVASAVVLVCVAFAVGFDTVVPDAVGDVGAAEHTARKRTETTQKGTAIIVAWGDITTIECE